MDRKERFIFCNQLSKDKMEKMNKETDDIYQHVLKTLYPDENERTKTESLVQATIDHIVKKEEKKIAFVSEVEGYDSCYIKDDPYYLVNFKPIYPLIKIMVFDKRFQINMLKFNIKPIPFNTRMREMTGGAVDGFLRIFNSAGEEFYKAMTMKGIEVDVRWKKFNTKGIAGSIINDIFRNMKMAGKPKKKDKSI